MSDLDETLWSIAGVNERLLIHERFGTKLDSELRSDTLSAGGVYEIDPANGNVIGSLVPGLYFPVIQLDARGDKFFGIDLAPANGANVHLVKVDRRSGHVDAVRQLTPDVWNIDLADVPANLIPRVSR